MGILFGGKTARGEDVPDAAAGSKARGDAALLSQLRVSCASFLAAACCILGMRVAKLPVLIGLLSGLHLISQAAAFNFLLPFAATAFPPAMRARRIAILLLAAQAGIWLGPN